MYKRIRMGEMCSEFCVGSTWCTWCLGTTRKLPQNTWNSRRSRVFSSAEATWMEQVYFPLHEDVPRTLCTMKATTALDISSNVFPVPFTTSGENWILCQSVVNLTLHSNLHYIAIFKELFSPEQVGKIVFFIFKEMEK